MSKISQNDRLGTIKDPVDFIRQASKLLGDIVLVINGKIEFGDNIQSQIVSVSFSAQNTDTSVNHALNKSSVNYFPVSKNVACDIYTGNRAANNKTIYLRSTQVASVTLVLF